MAQGGSGRTGGKARPGGRGTTSGKNGKSGSGRNTTTTSGGRPASRPASKQSAVAAQRAIKGARGKRMQTPWLVLGIVFVVVVAAAVVVGVVVANKHASVASGGVPPTGDTSKAVLASTAKQHTGDTVDGIQSNDNEQVLFHVHAHLAMYVNGQPKLLPYGVGIVPPYQLQQTADGPFVAGGTKFYWLHTHDETGVIHIESPSQRKFTLGNFFDEWNQPLSASQVGPDKGTVTAFVNGKKFTGNPKDIPLTTHAVIQVDVGTVVPFKNYTFPQGL